MATAVFLFTDIEGSTRRWAADPEGMRAALQVHDAALRAAVAAHDGNVFKHTGDGVLAVFATARTAVLAGADLQRRLRTADWGADQPLSVRVAVHAGEAEPLGEDWFGPALNRAARLLSLAHGGQVLVSDSAAAMARDGLPEGLTLTDLGVHRLRDLAHPERVWQLGGDGLQWAFPPLRSLEARPGNLSVALDSFIGRDADVAALAARMRTDRLVTLVGPGGVGKTRLAVHTAAASGDAFPDGVWVVELAPVFDAAAVDHAVASVLHLRPQAGRSPREVVFDALRGWRVLVVLDNCEHVVAQVRGLVGELLRGAPHVHLLATSREPLAVAGEVVWAVRPLPADTAGAQLFTDRAAAGGRSLLRGAADADTVRTICRRLDGMPLAIELAAARTGAMTAGEIAARLDRRFSLLRRRDSQDLEGRHASLHAVLAWSYDLLSADLQRFFCRLAVFPGSFNLDAAHNVCGDGDDDLDTLDLLDALVDKCLVTAEERQGRSRYWLLETMREYGAERLARHDLDVLRDRHARYVVRLVEAGWAGCRSQAEIEWSARLADNKGNLRSAVSWALGRCDPDMALTIVANLMPYARSRLDGEIWDWLHAALALPGALEHRLAPRAFAHAAFAANLTGDPQSGERVARRGLDVQARLGLPPEPSLTISFGAAIAFQGQPDQAADILAIAAAEAKQRGADYRYDAADATYLQCFTTLAAGRDPDPVLVAHALALAEEVGAHRSLANAQWALGVSIADSDPQRALDALEQAEALARAVDYRFLVGLAPLAAATVKADLDLVAGLTQVADTLAYLGTTRNRLGLRASLRALMPMLLAARRPDLVALADGAALPYTIKPHQAQAAAQQAAAELGADPYEHLRTRGGALDDDALIAVLRRGILAALAECQ